jgi:hypothetical protein
MHSGTLSCIPICDYKIYAIDRQFQNDRNKTLLQNFHVHNDYIKYLKILLQDSMVCVCCVSECTSHLLASLVIET